MVRKVGSVAAAKKSSGGIIKWGLLALAFIIIMRAVRRDSEQFKSGKENFTVQSATGQEHHPFPATPGPQQSSEMTFKSEGSCGTPNTTKSGTCGADGGCVSASGTKLLPVLDPCFNMREICKQSILLEDHLFQESKSCTDCIRKHFLCLEGLAEEAITLDKNNEYKFSKMKLPDKLRQIQKEYMAHKDNEKCAQALRQIRKPLMAKYYDKF